jgi:hypothetical protein
MQIIISAEPTEFIEMFSAIQTRRINKFLQPGTTYAVTKVLFIWHRKYTVSPLQIPAD